MGRGARKVRDKALGRLARWREAAKVAGQTDEEMGHLAAGTEATMGASSGLAEDGTILME